MDKTTHEVRLANWTALISECQSRPKGQTIKVWLNEHGVSEKQYYYWQRKVRKQAYDQMASNLPPAVSGDTGVTFAEIPVHAVKQQVSEKASLPQADVLIKSGEMTIAISNSVSDRLLDRILKVAGHA